MKHITTEDKHTLVLNEDEWLTLRCLVDCYNGAFAGLGFYDEDRERATKQLFKLFDIKCWIDKHNDDEW